MALINKALKFRVRCKDAETKLLLMRNEHNNLMDTVYSDYNKDGDEDLSNSISQELFVKTEDFIKIESLDYNSEDEKPLKYLVNEQMDTHFDNNDLDNNKDSVIHNTVTILENRLINIKNYKNNLKNTITTQNNEESSILNMEFLTAEDKASNQMVSNVIKIEDTENMKQEKERVTCSICKKSLSVRSVDAHMSKRHPGADERKVKCQFCDRYVLKEKLNRHLNMMHGKDCCICGVSEAQYSVFYFSYLTHWF